MLRTLYFTFLSLILLAGCAGTLFHGEPQIDRSSCEVQCHSWGMRLAGMVAMGHYSSGCLCENSGGKGALGATTGFGSAIVGTADILRTAR